MAGEVLRKTLSQNIKGFRSLRNWSQSELSEKAGISTNFLSDIERCKKWHYPETLLNIAIALDIQVYELFKNQETCGASEDERNFLAKFKNDVSVIVSQSIENLYEQYTGNIPANKGSCF